MTPAFVLALSALLHPGSGPTRAEVDFARAVAVVASADAPMPGRSREETAAILTVVGYRESRFQNVRSHHAGVTYSCSMQIHARSVDEARRLERDVVACVRRGLAIARASAALCPESPLAGYCGSCTKALPRRMSAERLALAASLLRRQRGKR